MANHQEGEEIIFLDIRVLVYANNRTKTDFSDEPLFWRKSAQLAVYCTFLFKEIVIGTILSKNQKEGVEPIFIGIRVLLNANNRTKADFADESLFWRRSAQLAVYGTFLFKEIGICTILSGNPQEKEHIIFMDIRVPLNGNNRTETDFADEPLFWRKSAQLSVYCTFVFKEIGICTILSGNHKEREQIIFMDIRVLLNANNRTERNFANEPLLWRKSAQLAVYCTFLFKEIVHLHYFIGKSPGRRANHFHGY